MIGNKIKNIRIGLGMSMEEFGRQFEPEADKGQVSKWESNKYSPNSRRIKRIAELGGVSVDELLTHDEQYKLAVDEAYTKIRQEYDELVSLKKAYKFNDDISYDLNGEVPKLYIKGKEVGVVSMTKHYVTMGVELGTNTTTFVYVTKDNPEQKVLSINNLGEVFEQ